MKKIALVFALAFAFTTGMAVMSVVVHTDRAMAFATVITHEGQAAGGCGGAGC